MDHHQITTTRGTEGEAETADGRRCGASSTTERHRRVRRRPLHAAVTSVASACLLVAATAASSSPAVLANAEGGESASSRPDRNDQRRLRHRDGGKNDGDRPASRSRRRRSLQSSYDKFCPGTYTGKAPTQKCAGYIDCKDGRVSSSVQACASGTQFDVGTKMCTWPDQVDCKTGDALLRQLGLEDGKREKDGDGGGDDDAPPSKFCPSRYTGRAPTTNCGGYVQCNSGKEGLRANCPPNSRFNKSSDMCEYNVNTCEMLVERGTDPDDAPLAGVNSLDAYCPVDYTGRAPIKDCGGYVDCRNGSAHRSKNCPSGTKFDVMIMACTFRSTGCDVHTEGIAAPTPSPVSYEDRMEAYQVGCTDDDTGYVVLPGCSEYVYCLNGEELNRFECSTGTLFDSAKGYCNWAENVECEDTAIPTRSPVKSPSLSPTMFPTQGPTELDLDDTGSIYYPDFTDGTCRNDGNFPPDVGRQYLFNSPDACCGRFFMSNMANCVRASEPTPAPTPAGGREWYPDYANNRCLNDGNAGRWETNFFFTYAQCCEFEWLDTVRCMRNMPSHQYYPDYEGNSCKNDGRQSPFESNTFETLEECCRFEWIDYGICMLGGVGGNDQTPTAPSAGPPSGTTVVYEYYPDYKNNVCHCNGKQSKFEINIFSSYDRCCHFDLVDTKTCMKYKTFQEEKCVEPSKIPPASSPSAPSSVADPIWYHDADMGLCRDDGRQPSGVLLSESFQVCCKRFMNQDRQNCRAKSRLESVTLNGGMRPNSAPASQPAPAEDPCSENTTKKQCVKDDGGCVWNENNGWGWCRSSGGYAPVPNPPPPAPVPLPAYDGCSNIARKKDCVKKDGCAFNTSTQRCYVDQADVMAPYVPQGKRYHPDTLRGICIYDENYGANDMSYDNLDDCCMNPWVVSYKRCIKGMGSADDEDDQQRGDDQSFSQKMYYPDYFYNVCRNDGMQSPLEDNLFSTMMECCKEVSFIDTGVCMSNAGS